MKHVDPPIPWEKLEPFVVPEKLTAVSIEWYKATCRFEKYVKSIGGVWHDNPTVRKKLLKLTPRLRAVYAQINADIPVKTTDIKLAKQTVNSAINQLLNHGLIVRHSYGHYIRNPRYEVE